MTFAIRPMTPQDLDEVISLAAGCEGAPQWSRAAYEELVSPTGAILRYAFVAGYAHQIAGFAVASWLPQNAEAEMETVVVAPSYRRQGAASGLLRACILAVSEAGAAAIRLEVRTSNAAARALYEGNGFAAIGMRRAYYSAPVEDAVLLRAPSIIRQGSIRIHGS